MGIGKEEDDLDLAEDLCLWVEEGRQVRDELQHDLEIIDDTCTGCNGGDDRLQKGKCVQLDTIPMVHQVICQFVNL